MALEEVETSPEAAQHAEREHIDLHHAERVDVVLVPFDEGAILHGGIADRHRLVEPFAREDEASDMLGEMPGKADELMGELHGLPDGGISGIEPDLANVIVCDALVSLPQTVLAKAAVTSRRQSQHLADFADGPARAVMDDGRANGRAVAPITIVDMLDDFLAPLMLEIDIDVGRLAAVLRNETSEEEVDLLGIDLGDAEAIADRAIGRRTSPLAEDALFAREGHHLMDGEEVALESELGDEGEFLGERLATSSGTPKGYLSLG